MKYLKEIILVTTIVLLISLYLLNKVLPLMGGSGLILGIYLYFRTSSTKKELLKNLKSKYRSVKNWFSTFNS